MIKQDYAQCSLTRKTGKDSASHMVSFIPAEFAVVGNYLKLKNMNGEWEDNWHVDSVGIKLAEEQLQIYRDVYRHTRDASDT